VTGQRLPGFITIEPRQKELNDLCEKYWGDKDKSFTVSGNSPPGSEDIAPSGKSFLSDDEVIEHATKANDKEKFLRLWNNEIGPYPSKEYPSKSEADFALCSILAFWTNRDPVVIDQLYRKSKLFTGKWDELRGSQTYGSITIKKAIEGNKDVFTPGNESITKKFRLWLGEAYGTFTIKQIYEDLYIKNQKDRNLIRKNLTREVEKGTLERGQITGVYRKVERETDQIEILDKNPEPLMIHIPGGVEEYVEIYPANIIVNAGSPNAGKTAFDLNFAYENRDRFEVIYWSSEMGSEEITLRTSKFEYPRDEWRKINFQKRTHDFHQIVDPNAVNIIDYLEVIEGEFYKIGDDIRKIYEKLDRGIALISLQMDTGQKYAWGGQKTLDKARLYITLDKGKMTLVKAKNLTGSRKVVTGLSRAYRLTDNGSRFEWEKWI
jgi:hypothetical protein